jgi:LPXTG-site transpeptidase (sortase) family protein
MQFKISLKPPLFIGSIATVAFSVMIIFLPAFNLPAQGSYIKLATSTNLLVGQLDPGLPIRLKIPKIKVDAAVEYVGVTPKGAMDIPKLPSNVAWFNLGSRPGEVGNAVIAGHVNWYNGAKSVFANLHKIKLGDKIFIKDDKGAEVSFIVRKVRIFGLEDDTSEVFISNDDKSHLNLITCIGVWNKKTKQYSQRLVVFAERE